MYMSPVNVNSSTVYNPTSTQTREITSQNPMSLTEWVQSKSTYFTNWFRQAPHARFADPNSQSATHTEHPTYKEVLVSEPHHRSEHVTRRLNFDQPVSPASQISTWHKILTVAGYIPYIGTIVGSYQIFCGLKTAYEEQSFQPAYPQLIRGSVEFIPWLGGGVCLIHDIFRALLDVASIPPSRSADLDTDDGSWERVHPELSEPLEAPFAWKVDNYSNTKQILPADSISITATREQKVWGYVPFVGTKIGIQRVIAAYKEIQLLNDNHGHSALRSRSWRWLVRGAIETIPFAGGAVCMASDFVATNYKKA